MSSAVLAPSRRFHNARTRRSAAQSIAIGASLGLGLWVDDVEAAPEPEPETIEVEAAEAAPDQPSADEAPDAVEAAPEPEPEPEPVDEATTPEPEATASPEHDEGVEYVDEDEGVEYVDEDEGVEYVDEAEAEGVDSEDSEDSVDPDPDAEPIRPPRFDGPYFGVLAMATTNFVKVIDLETKAPLFGGGGFIQAGDAVFPWMSIGIAAGGQAARVGNQQMFEGALLVELGFVPAKRYPLSLRAGFGFGGGAVKEQGVEGRSGFGGALFKASARYEFFPLAERKRPDRGGGWAIGPELGWLGATPAAKGQPFVNTILLGISTSFYFGS
ncbi:hypothetical protein ENSA5_00310 [Enhygromyxa salina]|uniref:Uncharacterized protein n=1 Tax=Enhygromyxa salina TaxID=215803 RepID=A0A2S9YLE7_9BACT|nr:hypothetical protein [Enhygromyxa salina]PRQ05919.1 hypothetical protein ENSA5_00310 [Enhygromyxa salina]